MTDFIGALGKAGLQRLFEKNFLYSNGGPFLVGNDTVDCGIEPGHAWLSNEPYSFNGVIDNPMWGQKVDPSKVTLQPGQTLLAFSSVNLGLIEGYAFFSPRSGMARIGVSATAHVAGFSEMNWAKGPGPMSRRVMVSITSRIPVRGLSKIPLFQMRVFTGDTRVKKEDLVNILRSGHDILINPRHGNPLSKERQMNAIADDGSLVTTLHLHEGMVGFRLKKKTPVLDVSLRNQKWEKYFEPIYSEKDGHGRLYVDLLEGEYYLLITEEGLHLPVGYVASLQQLDARLIAAVVHFAEYFGHGFKGGATLEVVPIAASIRVYQGSPIGAFRLEKVEPTSPVYTGFSANQHHLPQLPPTVTMPDLGEAEVRQALERR